MDVRFKDRNLEKLFTEPGDYGYPPEVVRAYRKKIGLLRGAQDEHDIRAMKSAHFEKLKGSRKHQRSLRLNRQWRLIVELRKAGRTIVIDVVGLEKHYE